MTRHRRLAAALATLLSAVLFGLTAGCSGVPGSSAAVDVTQIAEQVDAVAPLAPTAGQQPDQIVRGFISASARPELDAASGSSFAAARQYLTPDAQESWQPGEIPVVVLGDGYRTTVNRAAPGVVTVSGQTPGSLDLDRAFRPAATGEYSRALTLVQVDGEWRISDPPPELLLTTSEFPTAFRQRTLYFLDSSGTVVVPDVRHVVIGQTPANRANRLIAMLIDGPSSKLEGAVESEFTARSALRSNPSVDAEGVLQVDLTGVDVSTPEARRALAAQLVWTLSPTSPRIAITVDGEPLDPAQQVYTITTVTSFDPDRLAGTGQVASDPLFVTPDGAIVGLLDGTPAPGPLGTSDVPAVTAAQSAANGAIAAVTVDPAGGQDLLMARPQEDDRADPVLKAKTLTMPSFTRAGDEAWVVQNGATKPEVYRVASSANPSRERVNSTELGGKGAVTALVLSPDGVRVAVVAGEKLYVGVLTPPTDAQDTPPNAAGAAPTTDTAADPAVGRTPLEITKLTPLRPDLIHVGPVAFANSRELVVAASTTQGSYRSLWDVSIDGFEARELTDRGIFGDIDGLAVAAGEPMLIAFSGRIWQLEGSQVDGQWQSPLENEPFLNGSAPFYPG
ncbi:LpqB family beta-propeller domain-containing protein [Nakamurella sp. GG22]